jgi:hypothetical protein
MVKLTAKTRKVLPASDFAGPGRTFPDEDRAHAIAAKGRATQQWKKGRISTAERDRIVAKANDRLAKLKNGR